MPTQKLLKALSVLKKHPCITAKQFAIYYFDSKKDKYLFSAISNQGNGACAGKKAWLCAGSLLGKLAKQGYVSVRPYTYPKTFVLTQKGREMLNQSTDEQSTTM